MKPIQTIAPVLGAGLMAMLIVNCGGGGSNKPADDSPSAGDPLTKTNYTTLTAYAFDNYRKVRDALAAFDAYGSEHGFPDCDSGSGSATYTGAGATAPGAGDTVTGDLSACQVSFPGSLGSMTVDGKFSTAVSTASGSLVGEASADTGTLSTETSFNNLGIALTAPDTNVDARINGSATLSASETASALTAAMASSDIRFSFTDNGGSSEVTLSGMDVSLGQSKSEQAATAAIDMTFEEGGNGGEAVQLRLVTATPFEAVDNAEYPSSGSATLTSSAGGALTLTANDDGETVQLKLDENGDGVFEVDESATPWSSIDPRTSG